jgi:hypothetical protein
MGGAALILAYGLSRATEDADLLLDDREFQLLGEQSNFGEALERTNSELEPLGLYLSNIWGPEQQILTPAWREHCRPVTSLTLSRITLSALGPLDIITSKLARADDEDLADIEHLLRVERLVVEDVRAAVASAKVPDILREAFDDARPRLEALLRRAR